MTSGFAACSPLISLVRRGHSRFCWQAIESDVASIININFHDMQGSSVDEYGGGGAIGSVASDHATVALRDRRTL
jgi:hypothetical protein